MDGFVLVDMSGNIVECNDAYCGMLGYSPEETRRLNYIDITPERWHAMEEGIVRDQVLVRGYSEVYEKEYRHKSGQVFPVELRTCLLRDPGGEPRAMWAIVRDVSERKRTEARLSESEGQVRGVFDGAAIGMALADSSGRLVRINAALTAMLGYSEAEMMAMSFLDLTYPEDRKIDWDLHLELMAGSRDSFQIEKRYLRKDGRIIWGRLTTSALRGQGGAGGGLVIGMVEDISVRKEQEGRIERSLNEKAVLLREVHHRVKNNLQLVASMLALQKSYLPDGDESEALRDKLEDAIGRVRAMANIHELVYSTQDFTGIDFAAYLGSIAKEIAFGSGATTLELELDLEEIRMDLDTAIPCGLMVNEAMTNIAKHAYPESWQGPRRARVSLKARPGGIARIEIRDEGLGLARPDAEAGLGFTIMRALAQQIGGRMDVRSGQGTSVEFEI